MDWLTNPSSLHPTPSPRAISGYKDLKEPVSLSSGIILLQPAGFSLVLKLLYNICWWIASSIMYWATLPLNFSLGYKCSRIFHSNLLFIPDKGFTSLHITPSFHPPQLALPPTLHIPSCVFYIFSMPSFWDSQFSWVLVLGNAMFATFFASFRYSISQVSFILTHYFLLDRAFPGTSLHASRQPFTICLHLSSTKGSSS